MPLDELLRQMQGIGLERVILSPPPYTDESERNKSTTMYAVQSMMLRSALLRPVAALAARSFLRRSRRAPIFLENVHEGTWNSDQGSRAG